jgi:glycogen debranching enzyme|tara:strand:- start:151 stop:1401 length:1251 start_codon:yes stop_codon:yes gene_type:complete
MMKLLDQTARDILRLNDRGGYTVPTEGLYPYQWNWDSAFAAMGFAQFNVDRAWVEFETLFSGQWDNGMVPHILFHQVDEDYFPGPEMWKSVGPIPSSGITQPPVAATMVRLVFERNPNVGLARLAPLYDKIVAWHDWFMAWRLDQGAVCTTHPWETGRDNAPDWDGAMAAIDPVGVGEYRRRDTSHVDSEMRPTREDYDRYVWLVQRGARLNWDDAAMLQDTPFRMADPSMTFTLMRAQRDLAELGRSLGRDVSTIEGQIAKLESGAQTLWNETLGCYDSRDTRTGEWANSISNASFLCWYGGLPAPQMRAVLTHVLEGVTYGVPSFTPHDPKFEAKRYWRGPVWAVMNMLIGMGLDEMDLPEGQVLREGTADLITKHGFSEYFDPLDGSPAGGGTFTWTAAVWLGWASPDAGQNS